MLKIVGYPDRYSVAPGETIDFKISVEEGDTSRRGWCASSTATAIREGRD